MKNHESVIKSLQLEVDFYKVLLLLYLKNYQINHSSGEF